MYSSLEDALNDLEKNGALIRIREEVDPNLEMAEIHRQIFDKKGPAILFEKVKGSPFRAASNLFGTYERTDFFVPKNFSQNQKSNRIKSRSFTITQKSIAISGCSVYCH
jgi:4-hydroxy-3-polyprenylbenzoate decarboxylase